ncbi:hypothetical protein Scep_025799 [Stephania cephalantha]|uniref:Uncharacterized protein n=1 Tax=Stephania cephalantha TaxID=152367 RepID=A0AAP0EIV7_9MAGN
MMMATLSVAGSHNSVSGDNGHDSDDIYDSDVGFVVSGGSGGGGGGDVVVVGFQASIWSLSLAFEAQNVDGIKDI